MSSRREPLLWLQCLAIGAIPLELLLLRLVLAGADFGPVPGLERVFTWAIGAVVPAVLLWQRSPDWASLLLVRQPLSGRSDFQRQCSAAQSALPIKVLGASGAVLLLLLLWWIDSSALLVSDLSPLHNGSRLGSLLLAAPLLALVLWHWQQLIQATWLLTRDDGSLSALAPLTEAELQRSTTSFGLGLLKLSPLDWDVPIRSEVADTSAETTSASRSDHAEQTKQVETEQLETEQLETEQVETVPVESEPVETSSSSVADTPLTSDTPSALENEESAADSMSVVAGTVEPEQSTKEHDGPDLNGEVADDDTVSSADPEAHDEQTEASGSEQSDPQQPPETSPGGA